MGNCPFIGHRQSGFTTGTVGQDESITERRYAF